MAKPDPNDVPQTVEAKQVFERRRREWNTQGVRTAAITAITLIVLSTILEEMLGMPRAFERNALRISCLGLLVLGLLLTRRNDFTGVHLDWLMAVTYVWIGVFCVRLMLIHDGYESPYFLTLAFCVIGVPAVTLWPFWLFLAFEAALGVVYLAPLALGVATIRSDETFLVRLYFLLGLGLIGGAAQWMYKRMVRREAEAQAQLGAALRRISGMKAERLAWLESLAGFLRHELKNQIVAIGTSLDLMERSTPIVERERYVSRARRSLGRMGRLVASATEATNLEAALATDSVAVVDLGAILEDRVVCFREALRPHGPVMIINDGLTIAGNEDRLAQMIDKLLSNAIEHAAEDGEIRVALERDGQEAVLRIEDDGDPLPPDKERLFDAFVSVGKGKAGAQNLGLGLFVARVIVESLQGSVVAEDLPDDNGARFVVRLPLVSSTPSSMA